MLHNIEKQCIASKSRSATEPFEPPSQDSYRGGGRGGTSPPPPPLSKIPPPLLNHHKYYNKVVLKHKQQQSDKCCSKNVCICSKTPIIFPKVYSSCRNRHCFLVVVGGGGGGGVKWFSPPPLFEKSCMKPCPFPTPLCIINEVKQRGISTKFNRGAGGGGGGAHPLTPLLDLPMSESFSAILSI